ncbi:MAG: hypothetical protein QY320_00400 [Gammaproteobacteria bacterium]|nr:MAG: hypothetical protein QY320_00400 [Gammaproteobacteria bacterium]
MTEITPTIGNWYRHENGELFEVVARDETDATVEIQYFDGTVEELDQDAWDELEIEEAEAPEDWTGSVDVDEEELEQLADRPNENFDDPLEYLDRQD